MMKKQVVVISLTLLSLSLVQCKDDKTTEQTAGTPVAVEETIPITVEAIPESDTDRFLLGTYQGVFPWQEEGGEEIETLRVTAEIKEDNKYVYKVVSSTGTHTEMGEWELDKDRLYLREDEYSAANVFLIDGTKLYFLDNEGEIVNKTAKGAYILSKD